MNFRDAYRVSGPLKDGEDRLAGTRHPATVTFKTREKRMAHSAIQLLQPTCIYHRETSLSIVYIG
jgi:hypothetical protein